jgi:hypothetical protein
VKLTKLSLMGATSLAIALVGMAPSFGHVHAGMHFRKDAQTAEEMLAAVTKDIGNISTALETKTKEMDERFRDLLDKQTKGAISPEDRAILKKAGEDYAAVVTDVQKLTKAFDDLKRELDVPLLKGGKDLEDHDRRMGIELQRRAFLFKGGDEAEFREDLTNLPVLKDYRSAARKLVKFGGIDSREQIMRTFTDGEKKAFDAASLDSAFFSPEMLGIEIDCNIECAELLDLYANVTVSRSTFMYPKIVDYGAIGSYQCDAKCDADLGPEGNIQYLNGKTFDFRGVFCFQRKVIAEANYDLLNFMFRAAARSYRINRNRALITGDGINEPLGWLTADCFPKRSTGAASFNAINFRQFVASVPVEYGPLTTVMHQNVFAYLASMVDNNGRFLFGDGLMTYTPDDVRERIRISNCLPDATEGGTLGDEANPLTTGSFLAATGAWASAYAQVNKRPMFMEQYIGGSSAWCVKYQFGAEDGGFVQCCPAVSVLVVGP